MRFFRYLSVFSIAFVAAQDATETFSCPDCEIVKRDVAVIGGGSAGTYTAYRLRDQNYTVAVIDRNDYLGGNAETYTAPNGWTIDTGVIVFSQIDTVKNYFSRFNVSLIPLTGGGSRESYIDYRTGQSVTDFVPSSTEDFKIGITNYAEQLAKYPYLNIGFNLTYPIPSDSDLLLPFGEFAAKYNMSGAMQEIFITNQGYAPLLSIPTIYMFKYLNQGELDSFANGFLTTKNHDIQELYQHVAAYLGSENVFLNSTVLGTNRTSSPVQVLIQTPSGRKIIEARKLVIAAQPSLQNLESMNIDLTPNETNIFAQFFANGYYTGILTNTSLPANFSSQAIGPDSSTYNIPVLPSLYSASANQGAPDHIQVYYGSPTVLGSEYVQDEIVATINRIESANGLPVSTPQWAVFHAHTPFNLMVTPAAIQDRFYEKAFALQGTQGTFWNGAAWQTQDSSVIWQFTTEYLLPKILDALQE